MFKLLNRVRAYSFDGVSKKFLKWMFNKGKYMWVWGKKIHINFSHFYISFLDG